MLVDIKYAENDIVDFKFGNIVKSKCDCTFCGSTGTIRGLDGTDEECPRCAGLGYMELRNYQQTKEQGAIQKILVHWERKKEPQVSYMIGWKWKQTEVPQEDIIRKSGGVVI